MAGIAVVVCLLLPAMTNNHVSRNESMMGIIPAAIVFFLAFVLIIVSAVFVLKAKKTAAQTNG